MTAPADGTVPDGTAAHGTAADGTAVDGATVDGALRRDMLIRNQRGLHARAAAKFVKTAEGFDAEIEVEKGGTAVSGRSIMGLMMLAASRGGTIRVRADGSDAAAALNALAALVDGRFDEAE